MRCMLTCLRRRRRPPPPPAAPAPPRDSSDEREKVEKVRNPVLVPSLPKDTISPKRNNIKGKKAPSMTLALLDMTKSTKKKIPLSIKSRNSTTISEEEQEIAAKRLETLETRMWLVWTIDLLLLLIGIFQFIEFSLSSNYIYSALLWILGCVPINACVLYIHYKELRGFSLSSIEEKIAAGLIDNFNFDLNISLMSCFIFTIAGWESNLDGTLSIVLFYVGTCMDLILVVHAIINFFWVYPTSFVMISGLFIINAVASKTFGGVTHSLFIWMAVAGIILCSSIYLFLMCKAFATAISGGIERIIGTDCCCTGITTIALMKLWLTSFGLNVAMISCMLNFSNDNNVLFLDKYLSKTYREMHEKQREIWEPDLTVYSKDKLGAMDTKVHMSAMGYRDARRGVYKF